MEMAVEYARERQQFGRQIGAYQAVSHRCAAMLLAVEESRSLTYFAAWAAGADLLAHTPWTEALDDGLIRDCAAGMTWISTSFAWCRRASSTA